jgi:hypothetical protein
MSREREREKERPDLELESSALNEFPGVLSHGGPVVSQRVDLIRPEAVFRKGNKKDLNMQESIPKPWRGFIRLLYLNILPTLVNRKRYLSQLYLCIQPPKINQAFFLRFIKQTGVC